MSITVGIDSRAASEVALAAGIEVAYQRRQPLVIIPFSSCDAVCRDVLDDAILTAAGVGVQASVVFLDPKDELVEGFLRLARDVDASLIVIGTRQRFDVGRFVLSNDVLRIIMQADRPVLAVKYGRPPSPAALGPGSAVSGIHEPRLP